MKLSVAFLATIAALVVAQDPPKMPPGGGMGKGPPGGGMGKGGPPGGGKGGPPGGGKGGPPGGGKGGPPGGGKGGPGGGKGKGGGGFKMPCGVSCLTSPLKESGCKMPLPPKGSGGAPGGAPSGGAPPSGTSGGAPPKISMDPAAIQGYMDCMCSNNLVKDAFSKCVPEDCQKSGGNAEGLTKMYGSMCKDGKGVMPNFGKMGSPPGGAGGAGPKGPPGGAGGAGPKGPPGGAGGAGPKGPPGGGGGPPKGAGKGPAPPAPSK